MKKYYYSVDNVIVLFLSLLLIKKEEGAKGGMKNTKGDALRLIL